MRYHVFAAVLCLGVAGTSHASAPGLNLERFARDVQRFPAVAEDMNGDPYVAFRNWAGVREADIGTTGIWGPDRTLEANLPGMNGRCAYIGLARDTVACLKGEGRTDDLNFQLTFRNLTSSISLASIGQPLWTKRKYLSVWADRSGRDARVVTAQAFGGRWGLVYYYNISVPNASVIEVAYNKVDEIEPAVEEDDMVWVRRTTYDEYDKRYKIVGDTFATRFRNPMFIDYGRFPSLATDDGGKRWLAYERYPGSMRRTLAVGMVDVPSGAFQEYRTTFACEEPSRPIVSNVAGLMMVAYLCAPQVCTVGGANATLYVTEVSSGCTQEVANLGHRPGEEEPSPFAFWNEHLVYSALANPAMNDWDVVHDQTPARLREYHEMGVCPP